MGRHGRGLRGRGAFFGVCRLGDVRERARSAKGIARRHGGGTGGLRVQGFFCQAGEEERRRQVGIGFAWPRHRPEGRADPGRPGAGAGRPVERGQGLRVPGAPPARHTEGRLGRVRERQEGHRPGPAQRVQGQDVRVRRAPEGGRRGPGVQVREQTVAPWLPLQGVLLQPGARAGQPVHLRPPARAARADVRLSGHGLPRVLDDTQQGRQRVHEQGWHLPRGPHAEGGAPRQHQGQQGRHPHLRRHRGARRRVSQRAADGDRRGWRRQQGQAVLLPPRGARR
mmetsp:Transcript_24304/g.64881  ORF Transcript_24304/g.64881 Transcript_24304/m.64881 type:complete len:282 (-) Transcript_24304:1355-2200(-)